MKKIIKSIVLYLLFSCSGSSDSLTDLPGGYIFIREGVGLNQIYGKGIEIDSGAVDYRYNENYVLFSVDTTYSEKPSLIHKTKLRYYVYDIKKDSLVIKSKGYDVYKSFIEKEKLLDVDVSNPR